MIKRQRNHASLANQILYKTSSTARVAPLIWGQQHERDALNEYKKSLSPGNDVLECGIYVSDCGFLGASPDGFVHRSGTIIKLLEVKCP